MKHCIAATTCAWILSLSCRPGVLAMMASPHSFTEIQPDGEQVVLQLQGDPYDNYLSDDQGYTVLQNDQGEFVYAQLDSAGDLEASSEPVGKHKGAKKGSKKGLRPKNKCHKGEFCDQSGSRRLRGGTRRTLTRPVATTGTLKNLVVPIRWSDHATRTLPTKEELDTLMNHDGPHHLCPTGSVKDVFLQNSHGALELDSTVVNWVPLNHTEEYYANAKSGLSTLMHDAIRQALQYLDDHQLVDFADYDDNGDGVIDSITFLHSGYGAEWGGTDAYGAFYKNRIWSHKWALWTGPFVSHSGIRVQAYHISPAVWGRRGHTIGRIGVIAHETGHFLGLPDLYDVDGGGVGLGSWGLMANAWGFDGSQYFPPLLSAWSRVQLGWAVAMSPSEGTNLVEAAGNQRAVYPQVYRVDEGFPKGEYLLIENRQADGFDSMIPHGGLAIYHVDEKSTLTAEGHPDQDGWPSNGNHYGVALLQADGKFDLEKGEGRGDDGDLYHGQGNSTLLPSIRPEEGPFPNTDAYQLGSVTPTGIQIVNIGDSTDVMSFYYRVGQETLQPSSNPTMMETATPTPFPTATTTDAPTQMPSPQPTTTQPSDSTQAPTGFPTNTPTAIPSNAPTDAKVCLARGKKCTSDSDCCSNKCRRRRRWRRSKCK